MDKLCLMASHGYPPGNGLVFVQERTRVFKELQPYFPNQGGSHEIRRPNPLSMEPLHNEPWRPVSGFYNSSQLAKIDTPVGKPVIIDVQEPCPDSVLFSLGIAEQCAKHEKILNFLTSGSAELEKGELDLSLLSDLIDTRALALDVHQQSYSPLVYPDGSFGAPKPLVDFVGEIAGSSKISVLPDGRVLFTGSGTEMKDILSIVAEFYLSSKTSTRRKQQPMLVPHFSWSRVSEAQADVLSSLNVKDVTAPLKRIKHKPSKKKKNSRKSSKERDLYERNYFHACESLLSLMMYKKQHGKTAILALKKSGPELPSLLSQFSAGIAGTGLAVVFAVVCKLACGRLPLCGTKLLSTGFGIGLVWLSWAVNQLRDTIVYISKNSSKFGLKDDEILKSVDKSLKDIYFRAATLVVVAALRLA